MKKILLFALGAMMSMASFAQDGEDVTHLIKNAGFEEDLTFQADGTMKEAVSTTTSLSERSWAYIAADNTVYARPKSTSSQNRPDGRKMEAVNGFKGQIQGWTMESSGTFPACEWTYFGSVPYDLPATAVPIADDGSTYLAVPARPSNGEFEAGNAFVYLRAGWTNQAIYKQEVSLPCAKYRLEYWTININPNTSAVAEDLTKIVCRKDEFKDVDGTGLQAQEWTKHEFEFTPTSRFTMQFGYKAANAGSGGQPIVALDGIKLYKIGEADPQEIIIAMGYECEELSGQAYYLGYEHLSSQINDYGFVLEGIDYTDITAAAKAIEEADEIMDKFRNAIAEAEKVDAILAQMESILASTDYAGKDDFRAAYNKILSYKEGGNYDETLDYAALILGAVAEAKAAIRAYYLSQEASEANPADYTFLVENPLFVKETAAPTLIDGIYVYPNEVNYADGSNNDDFLQTPWVVSGTYTGGDQRTNYKFGLSCWNAWGSGITGTVAISQTIENLPNGYYTASAKMVTQSGMLNDQKVFVESTAEKNGAQMTKESWDAGEWEQVSMTADQKVLVVDGKLTLGAEGTGTGEGSIGWFCVTDFKLQYLGEASADALKAAFEARLAAAKELADKMHFAADKAVLNDSINKYAAATDYVAALSAIAAAINEATKSEAKYEEYFMEGKTLPTIELNLKGEGETNYGIAKEIAQYAYDYAINWINSAEASYTKIDSVVNHTKDYVNTYVPAYISAGEVAEAAKQTGKEALQKLMNGQKTILLSEIQYVNVINDFVAALNELVAMVNKQNIVDDANATDYTAFIQNPNLEAEDGWQFVRGNGDKNTTSSQWLDGSNTRYIDSYHSEDVKDPDTEEVTGHIGLVGFKGWQEVKDLPNGTYEVGVYTRTPAEGAYIFTSVAEADTAFVEIPLNYYTAYNDETGEEELAIASDTRGPIWEEAVAKIEAGIDASDPLYDYWYDVYNANNSLGRGWKHQTMTATVTNHVLTIGIKAGVEGENAKAFTGNWFSAGGWTLKLTAKGDNTGWDGPVATGVEAVKTAKNEINGIYTLTGAKVNQLQRGLNIVVRNGKAMKVMVK